MEIAGWKLTPLRPKGRGKREHKLRGRNSPPSIPGTTFCRCLETTKVKFKCLLHCMKDGLSFNEPLAFSLVNKDMPTGKIGMFAGKILPGILSIMVF